MPTDDELPQCEHGSLRGFCWDCLTPEQQAESKAVWDRLQEEVPDLHEALERSRREIAEGKVIRFKRSEATGRTIVMPHSVFREVVDMIHEDKKKRGLV